MGLFSIFRSKPDTDPLDDLLGRAANDSSRRSQFYRVVMESPVHVPGEVQDGELFIRPYTLDGRKTLLFFSSPRLASALRDRPALVELPGRMLLQAGAGFESVIMNYASRNQKEFTLSEIAAMLDGSIFSEGPGCAVSTVVIGRPKEYPVRLMNELSHRFSSTLEIRAAYLAQISPQETSYAPVVMIVLDADCDDDTFQDIRGNIIRLASQFDAPRLDVVRLADDPLGAYVRGEVEAFYEVKIQNSKGKNDGDEMVS